jgi:integrase
MPPLKLTKRNVDTLKPAAERYTAWDTEIKGFGLRVTPSGERVYVLKYRIEGEQRWFTIGRHGSPWTPDGARDEAKRLIGDVAKKIDPAAQRCADREAITFATLRDLYLAEGVAHKKQSTVAADRGRIKHHLKPLLGKKRVVAIGRDDIERLLVDVKAGKTKAGAPEKRRPGTLPKGGPGVAAQCVTLAATILQFAVARKLRDDNPARGVKKPPVRKLQRFLSDAELGKLADALKAYVDGGGNIYPAAAIRLLALTGARRSEILSLQWREVDLERGLLVLPDSKTGAKLIHLSPPAAEILDKLPHLDANEFVIAGGREGTSYQGLNAIWEDVRAAAGLPDVRLHDLRHTFASIGAGASLGLPIIGKLLGHTQAQTTARYAHLADDPLRKASNTIGATIAAAMSRRFDREDSERKGDVVKLKKGGTRG